MSSSWSEALESRYALRLPPDLRAWMDDELWRDAGGAEFCRPLSPEELLAPSDDWLWPGFLPPDLLPIIGNHYGDWLCLRIGPTGEVLETLYWCHGGGDWIPYGRTLAEALVYDAAFRVLYDRRPQFVEPESSPEQVFHAAEWALPHAIADPVRRVRFWEAPAAASLSSDALLQSLLDAGVRSPALHRDRILQSLGSGLRDRGNPGLASELGTVWEPDFISWLFDTTLIPELTRSELERRFGTPIAELTTQDWEGAEREALAVVAERDDLAWAFDIAGWAAERRGDLLPAANLYRRGLRATVFGDESVRLRTHWFPEGRGKFSAFRLAELRDDIAREAPRLAQELAADRYFALFVVDDGESLRHRIRDHWLAEAQQFSMSGRFWDAYRAYCAAGWDLGLRELSSYDELLRGAAHAARAAGAEGLARLAEIHVELLAERL